MLDTQQYIDAASSYVNQKAQEAGQFVYRNRRSLANAGRAIAAASLLTAGAMGIAGARTVDDSDGPGFRAGSTSTDTLTPVPSPTALSSGDTLVIRIHAIDPAPRDGSNWLLRHPDEDHTVSVSLPDGFTPDKNLHVATDLNVLDIGTDYKIYQDWETALNTKRPASLGGPLAGYNYDYNDFCQVPGFYCNVQMDMYGWRVLQGQEVRVPGIGTLVGGPRRSVVLDVLNLDGSVDAFDVDSNGPIYDKRGFTATGRIFDGRHGVDALERNLAGHWLFTQFNGEPRKSYIGITNSPDNALEVLLVSVQRKQWGNNPDGSKRMEYQLLRAQLVKLQGGAAATATPVPTK